MIYEKKNFEQVYRRNYQQMYRYAFSLLAKDLGQRSQDLCQEDARDAVSQVFTQMWHRKPQLKEDAVTGYLMAAVRNHCLNLLRTRRLQTAMEAELKAEQQLQQAEERQELMDELQRVIEAHLTEQDKRILALHYDEAQTYTETAKTLGISPSAVNKHITHSLSKIRSIFKTAQS